jgi:dihydroflavonol-4-reductase|tara:strand:+ start:244 stop:1233 length:990 start_codon:yes stop_codon:yes gene_type:complete
LSIALITGSSGHVGSNLIRELSKQDYKIRCIDFDGDYRAYEGFDVEVIKGDITNKDSLRSVFKNVDIVFHTAALINLDRRYEKQIRQVNVEGTRNVCEAAVKAGVKKLIHFSSVDAFYRFPIEEPLLESRSLIDDPNAVPYDLSKADGQKIVLEFCEKDLDASIIHPTSIVGPNDFKPGLPMQEMVNLANGKRKLVPNWGYNFVDVRDLCITAISAVKLGRTGQNYIVGGEYHLYSYIAELMKQQLGRTVLLATIPDFVSYLGLPYEYIKSLITRKPRVLTIDTLHTGKTGNKVVPSTLAREELGHNPRPLEETIYDMVSFFQKRGLIK